MYRELSSVEETERAVLGALITSPESAADIVAELGDDPAIFSVETHRQAYTAILNLFRDGDPIDIVSIPAADPRVDHMVLSHLIDSYGFSSNGTYYAKVVREAYLKRRIVAMCSKVMNQAKAADTAIDDLLSSFEEDAFGLTLHSRAGAVGMRELVPGVRAQIEAVIAGEDLPGVKTGFASLDCLLRPWRGGDYIIVAATPSVGKTTLACNLAINAARREVPVLILSLEMDAESITRKLVQICGGVDLQAIERRQFSAGFTSTNAQMAIAKGCREVSDLPITVLNQGGMTPLEMRSCVRSGVSKNKVGLVIIDYLQLMSEKAESRTSEVSKISRSVKAAATEAGVPIVALSQLSRAGAEVQPRLNHLRESGSLEQDADVVILLSKTDEDGVVLADIAKQRVAATGEVKLMFHKPTQRFGDLSRRPPGIEPPPSRQETGEFDEYVNSGFGHQIDHVEDRYEEDDTAF